MKKARLSAVALGVAGGVICGGWMLIVGLLAWKGIYGVDFVTQWATHLPGVQVSLAGGLIAGCWGFVKGFVSGLVFGWLYNLCLCCCSRGHCACCKTSGGGCTCSCSSSNVEKA